MSICKRIIEKKNMIVAGALLSAIVGCSGPTIQKNADLTGDGIPDLIIDIKMGLQKGTWLFIGQNDGTYVRAKELGADGVEYFKTDNGDKYAFDGTIYRPIVPYDN